MNSITDFINNTINESQNNPEISLVYFNSRTSNPKLFIAFGTPENPMSPDEVKKLLSVKNFENAIYADPDPSEPEETLAVTTLHSWNGEISWANPKNLILIK